MSTASNNHPYHHHTYYAQPAKMDPTQLFASQASLYPTNTQARAMDCRSYYTGSPASTSIGARAACYAVERQRRRRLSLEEAMNNVLHFPDEAGDGSGKVGSVFSAHESGRGSPSLGWRVLNPHTRTHRQKSGGLNMEMWDSSLNS